MAWQGPRRIMRPRKPTHQPISMHQHHNLDSQSRRELGQCELRVFPQLHTLLLVHEAAQPLCELGVDPMHTDE